MGCDRTHIPHYRTLGIEVCRTDGEHAPPCVLGSDLLQEFAIHVFRDECLKWTCIGERFSAKNTRHELRDDEFVGMCLCPDLSDLRIKFGSEKREGRNDCAC